MGSRSVKLTESFVEIAESEGQVMRRTIGAQIEYWAEIGREVEASGALGIDGVRRLLAGQGSVQDISDHDEASYLDELTQKLESIDGSSTRVVDSLRTRGFSIASADDRGEVSVEKPSHLNASRD